MAEDIVIISHDKETYSEVDLTKIGAYAYAAHPSTDCLLTSGRVKGEKRIRRWRPGDPYPYADIEPRRIRIRAWNSQFERLIWRHVMVPVYGWPELELEQFECTSARGRITAAGPAKLDVAARFFNRPIKKDNRGHLHMLKMCRPASEKEQLAYLQYLHGAKAHIARNIAHPNELKRCHHTRPNIDRLHDYCDVDVLSEDGIADMLPPWSEEDLEDFWLNERINDHGLVVDVDFAQAATTYAEDEKAYFAQRIVELTDGAVETPRQFQRIKAWALPLLSDEAQDMIAHYDNGVKKYSFDADGRANLLAEASADLDWIAYDPRNAELLVEFIELLDAAGKSTIAKYQAIANYAVTGNTDENARVHGAYMFAGASQSGRFSSKGIQLHNLVRDIPKNTPKLISAFKRKNENVVWAEVEAWAKAKNDNMPKPDRGAHKAALQIAGGYAEAEGRDVTHSRNNMKRAGVARNPGRGIKETKVEPIHALGTLVRPTFTGCPADGFDLVWGDWSSIEACALPWLSLDKDAEDRLDLLRRGEDIYLKTASGILGRKVTKDDKEDRQAFGKVPELSLGYLGGNGAFKAMAKNYGVRLPDSLITKVVKSWREDNPWAPRFGKACEQAAMAALRRKDGASFSAGRLEYWFDPDALDGIGLLHCVLPSGRAIPYPGARIQVVKTKWGEEKLGITAMKSAWQSKKDEPWEHWPRVSLWPGLLIENGTQAICADLLRLGLVRAERAGLALCGHTHDEIMIETPEPERDAKVLHRLMVKRPPWPGADMLPLRAEVEYGFRYKVKFEEAA